MFLEFVALGLALLIGLASTSPFPQQLKNQTTGQEIPLEQTPQTLQKVRQKPAQSGFQQAQLRSSFPNQRYYRPSSNNGFGPEYSDYDDPYFQGYRPNGGGRFDSSIPPFGRGNPNGFGGWNRPIRPRPVGAGDRGFGAGGRGSNSFDNPVSNDGNQLGSGGADNQQGSGSSSSGGGDQGSDGEVQPQNGGQPWTTVRSPVNRIFGEYTVPELAQCISACPSFSHYDPICGSDNITYTNRAKFQCAQQCGRVVTEAYRGSCASATT